MSRAPKYACALLAAKSTVLNGETFGTYIVAGQTVYLSATPPEHDTLQQIALSGGIYYPAEHWSYHRATYEWKPLFPAIVAQLQTAKIYAAGFKGLVGRNGGSVAAIFETAAIGGWDRLRWERRRKFVSSDIAEVREWWATHCPDLEVLEEVINIDTPQKSDAL